MTAHTQPITRRRAQSPMLPWWVFLVTGIAWIVVSLLVLQFDVTSVATIALLVGIGLLVAGAMELVQGATAPGWSWLHALLGVLFIGGGVVSLLWPGETIVVLANLLGWFLLVKGTFDVIEAFAIKDVLDVWWMQLVLGVLEIGLAFWVVGYPGRELALLIIWVGVAALVKGITEIFLAFRLKRVGAPEVAGAPAGTPPGTLPRQATRTEESATERPRSTG
ncbi:MAG: HdeD family acid-resistance protein [Carbonactinosporaceae bacterium]